MGHVFKSKTSNDIPYDVILRNKRRVAEVWMDEYKAFFLKRTPDAAKVTVGMVTEVKQMTSQNCFHRKTRETSQAVLCYEINCNANPFHGSLSTFIRSCTFRSWTHA